MAGPLLRARGLGQAAGTLRGADGNITNGPLSPRRDLGASRELQRAHTHWIKSRQTGSQSKH